MYHRLYVFIFQLDVYRSLVPWTQVNPDDTKVKLKGIEHDKKLIKGLLAREIEPFEQ